MAAPRIVPRTQVYPLTSGEVLAPGARFTPKLENLPRDVNGFPAHVLGMYVRLVITYSAVAATMAQAAQGWRLFNAIQSWTLKVKDHSFFDQLRGERLYHDSRRMALSDVITAPSTIADADAANTVVTCDLYVPFANPRPPFGAEYDGAIPVACLRPGDLQLIMSASTGLGISGLTWSTATLSLWAEIHHGTQLRIPTPWSVKVREDSSTTISETPNGFLHYVDFFDSHAMEVPNASAYTGLRVAIGDAELPAQTFTDRCLEHNINVGKKGVVSTALSLSAPEFLPLIRPGAGELLTRQPRGKMRIQFTARPNITTSAIQYREHGVRSDAYMRGMYERLEAKAPISIETRSAKKHAPTWLQPHLDASVAWPRMEYGGVAERASFRGR